MCVCVITPHTKENVSEQHLDEVTWTTKNWHGLQMQRLSVVLHTAVAWQTVNELACGESGIVHGAECIAVLNGVA